MTAVANIFGISAEQCAEAMLFALLQPNELLQKVGGACFINASGDPIMKKVIPNMDQRRKVVEHTDGIIGQL